MFKKTAKSADRPQLSNLIYFHDDYSASNVSESLVGRKALSLFHMHDKDVPVPHFFVISPEAYKSFVLKVFDDSLERVIEKVKTPDYLEFEKLFMNAPMPADIQKAVREAYVRLSGFSESWVAVRSSIVYPYDETLAFPGVFKTELNVRGYKDLERAIRYVYLSIFSENSLDYASRHGIDLRKAQMAVVVQSMIQPEVSGVAYTVDPITEDTDKITVEAVFGLGDVIADGEIRPDLYVMDKKTLEIVEKHISPQEWMKVRTLHPGRETTAVEQFEKVRISRAWSHRQKFEDHFIEEVGRIAKLLDARNPVAIEWVFESGKLWILQAKEIPASKAVKIFPKVRRKVAQAEVPELPKDPYSLALGIMESEVGGSSTDASSTESGREAKKSATSKKPTTQSKQAKAKLKKISSLKKIVTRFLPQESTARKKKTKSTANSVDELQDVRFEYLMSGVGVSAGEVSGRVIVVNDDISKRKDVLPDNAILLFPSYHPKYEKYVSSAKGVIADDGGTTSDLAQLCREYKIPAVLGTGLASYILKDMDLVRIDGSAGSLYKQSDEQLPQEQILLGENTVDDTSVEAKEKETSSEALEIDENDTAKESRESTSENTGQTVRKAVGRNEKPPMATKLYAISSPTLLQNVDENIGLLDGVFGVDMDEILLSQKRHLLAYVQDKKFREYSSKTAKVLDQYAKTFAGREVVVTLGLHPVSEFRDLIRGKSSEPSELDGQITGAIRYIKSPKLLEKVIAVIRRARTVHHNRNISLAVYRPVNESVLKEFKKYVTAGGLKRTSTFKLYAVLTSASELMLAQKMMRVGIDGMVVDMRRLVESIAGGAEYVNKQHEKTVDEIVRDFIHEFKNENVRMMVNIAEKDESVENLVEYGAHDIIVSADKLQSAIRHITDAETRIVLNA